MFFRENKLIIKMLTEPSDAVRFTTKRDLIITIKLKGYGQPVLTDPFV
jgi:hypothetical protein